MAVRERPSFGPIPFSTQSTAAVLGKDLQYRPSAMSQPGGLSRCPGPEALPSVLGWGAYERLSET